MSVARRRRIAARASHVEQRLSERGVWVGLLGLEENSFWLEVRTSQETLLSDVVRELYLKWDDLHSVYVSVWTNNSGKSITCQFNPAPEFETSEDDEAEK